MGPGYDGAPPGTGGHGRPHPTLANEMVYQQERERISRSPGRPWQDTSSHASLPGRAPGSPAVSIGDRDLDPDARRSAERNRSRQRSNGRSASGQPRICKKCDEPLTGQFVRALEGTFHLDCFRCRDCGQIVASKFFPAEDENGGGQYPLCETDYFRRLGLLCYQCGGALRGSYITALERKYHVDHFTCSLCSTVFGAQDSYYEHDGQVYCHYHYSTQFAQRCNGCQTAILKQFVEIFRNGQNQHWHPECYMIHKFWNVRLVESSEEQPHPDDLSPAARDLVRVDEERMEEKVYRIWSVLSTFEESSAACISDMLLHVSNGAYVDGVVVAKKFIWHVDLLFQSADRLDATTSKYDVKSLTYGREAKLLCKKIVAFFSLLSKTQDKDSRKLGVTQELLSLVTALAHYLKLLIRICLQGALRVEKKSDSPEAMYQFLDDLGDLDTLKVDDGNLQITGLMSRLSANDSDQCTLCRKPIEDECTMSGDRRWHMACTGCTRCGKDLSKTLDDARLNNYDLKIFCSTDEALVTEMGLPFERVSKLQQYIFLLRVALARLLEILRSTGALPQSGDDVASNGYDTVDGSRMPADSRSKSYAGEEGHQRESSYESTLNDVRRLRSTRLDKHLSSSFRKARTSQIMDGPGQPGMSGVEGPSQQGMDTVDERGSDMMFGHQDALTLDDIPRIVAAEQAREQRPIGFGARQDLFRSPATEPHLGASGGDPKGFSTRDMDPRQFGEPSPQRGGRKYFSELSGLEYFIVRHIAVLNMHPILDSEFTLEELLGFIESKKPATFWNKFGKAFKNDGKKNVKKKGVFGVPLEVIIDRDGAESTDGVGPGTLRIPAIVDDIVATMRKMDLSVEGVFRKNGNIKKLTDLCERIDREGCDNIDLSAQPVIQIAALLKRYLRELPDPLMTHKLYRLWLAAAKINDDDKRRACLHLICCLLPKCNRDFMEILFCFFKYASTFNQVDDESGSKMDIKNIATVIAPNILFVNTKALSLDSDPMFAITAVETLMHNVEAMCLVPDRVVDVLNDPSLFSNSGDLTTKEILKRYGDLNIGGPRPEVIGEFMNRNENSIRPPARRVETDPNAWQDERTVRPVQDSFMPYVPANQSTPPKWRGGEEGHPSPYGTQGFAPSASGGTSENTASGDQQRREWRNSGWGRDNSSVGVTGTG